MRAAFCSVLLCFFMTACKADGDPRILWVSFNTYHSSPVVITSFMLNGHETVLAPDLVAGRADLPEPRSGSSEKLVDYPVGADEGRLHFSAQWTEFLTGHTWSVEATAPLGAFVEVSDGAIKVRPVFGPNGLFIMTSDPLPVSATEFVLNDVIKLCGTYMPMKNHDFKAESDELAGGIELLALDYPVVTNPECSYPEN